MKKGSNKYEKLVESLQGIYTLETLAERLKINTSKAIYVIYRLRKLGYVKTSYGAKKKRIYNISLVNKQKGVSYTEKINEVSPSASYAILSSNPYYIHDRIPSYEEVLIYAVQQKNIRYLIASLALFRKISNWSLLYTLAKKENLLREIAALYEVAKKIVKKIKRMPKRFLNLTRRSKAVHFKYLVEPLSSDDFKNIEKKWKVYIPLNRTDLEEYTR